MAVLKPCTVNRLFREMFSERGNLDIDADPYYICVPTARLETVPVIRRPNLFLRLIFVNPFVFSVIL